MQISLSFKPLSCRSVLLEAGKTLSFATAPGARVRVLDGMVWATTSPSPNDVWLRSGEEHTVKRRGVTVIESVASSTVELIPPAAGKTCGRILNRYDIAAPKLAFRLAAVAMAALVVGLLVILPATMDRAASSEPSIVATVPARIVVTGSREAKASRNETLASATNAASRPTGAQ